MHAAPEPIRAVVDLNLFVSGLISRLGQPFQLVEYLRQDAFLVVISQQLRDELEEVLRREKFVTRFGLTAESRDAFLALLDAKAQAVTPSLVLPVRVRDQNDEIVLATALGGDADYLVTGDEDLLVLRGERSIAPLQIVTVREFLQALARVTPKTSS